MVQEIFIKAAVPKPHSKRLLVRRHPQAIREANETESRDCLCREGEGD